MMRYLSFAFALLLISSVQAEGGLRRLRRDVADHDSSVNANFLDLAQEVQGPALHRVLRYKQAAGSRNRKMLRFVSYFDLIHGRDNDGFGNSDPWFANQPETEAPEESPLSLSLSMSLSMSMSMSMSMPLSDRINDDIKADGGDFVTEDDLSLSLSLSMSMSLPLEERVKDDKVVEASEDYINEEVADEDLSLSMSMSLSMSL